jgi:hypothetical protein
MSEVDLLDDILLPVQGDLDPLTKIMLPPQLRVDLDELDALIQKERDYPYDPLWLKKYVPALIAELRVYRAEHARPSPNGSAYEVACFGCGKKFTVKRRPIPGRHRWCDTCRASGEPAAQRARDYRARKHEGEVR